MALESANLPIPSEIVMPFSGYLVSQGQMNFILVVLAGAIGCTVGSLFSYWLGYISEGTWIRVWINGWGKILISPKELELSEKWLRRHGDVVTFFSRLLPVVRTFISFPSGMAQINLARFTIYSFLGSLLWSLFLTYIGYSLGTHWDSLHPYFQKFDYLILIAIIIVLGWLIYHRVRRLK